jgi:hypothetical protein
MPLAVNREKGAAMRSAFEKVVGSVLRTFRHVFHTDKSEAV